MSKENADRNEDWLSVVCEIATNAGKLIRKKAKTKPIITHKGPVDLVTDADIESEKYIISELERGFPGHSILGEEQGGSREGDFLWAIDPIDGTTNYAHGFPVYAVSIGLFANGQPTLGVVYDPNLNELFAASRGGGATLNGKPISVSKTDNLNESLLATGFPYSLRENPDKIMADFKRLSLLCQGVRRTGAASLDLCALACGRFDGFWEVELKPWDTAAAGLIVEEAGGRLSKYDGSAFDHFHPGLVASNGLIHNQLVENL
ncbi:MAG TPA: inositol monophosphatase [Actinobacteria bacterium]|nr:inositol monophosphatase [Actinomycetota bacterium]